MMSFNGWRKICAWGAKPCGAEIFYPMLGCLVLAAWALRLLLALGALTQEDGALLLRPDSPSYYEPAQALAAGEGYRAALHQDAPAVLRPPGYPLLLAGGFIWWGESFARAGAAGAFLGALVLIPVALAGRLLYGGRAGLLAAVLVGLNLTAIANSVQILSDNLLFFVIAWQLYFLLRVYRSGKLSDFGWFAAIAAVGCLVKPVNLPFSILAVPFLGCMLLSSWKKRWGALGIAAGAFAILVLPYWVRTDRLVGGFDSNSANIYYHTGSAILAAEMGENSDSIREKLIADTEAVFAADPERYHAIRAQSQYKIEQFRVLVKRYPMTTLKLHLHPEMQLLPDLPSLLENNKVSSTGQGTMAVLRQKGLIAAVDHYLGGRWQWLLIPMPLLLIVAMTYCGFGKIIVWLRHWQWRLLMIAGASILYYLLAPGPVISPRYQLPALPLLAVMAAGFWLGRVEEPRVLRHNSTATTRKK